MKNKEIDILTWQQVPEEVRFFYNLIEKCYEHNLYIPALIMVRRTIEQFMAEQDIKGKNLNAKIEKLSQKCKYTEFLDFMRKIGNDCAHECCIHLFSINCLEKQTKNCLINLKRFLRLYYWKKL